VVLEVPTLRPRLGDLPDIAAAILARSASEEGAAPKRLSSQALAALSRYAWPGNVRELENALRAAALFSEGETIELMHFTSNVEGFQWLAGASGEPDACDAPRPGQRGSTESSKPPSAPPLSDAASRPSEPSVHVGRDSVPAGPSVHVGRDSASADPSRCGGEEQGASPWRRDPVEIAYEKVRAGTSLSDIKREIERECISRALEESRGNITRAATLLGMKRPRLSQLVKQYGFGGVSEE
jgi:DNA-binding NtrC family response regulator